MVVFDAEEQAHFDKLPEDDGKKAIWRDLKRSTKIQSYVRKRMKLGKTGIELSGNLIKVTPDFCREAVHRIYGFLGKMI